MWFSVAFERGALSRALPFLGTLPTETYTALEGVWEAILRYNTLADGIAEAADRDKPRVADEAKQAASVARGAFLHAAQLLEQELGTETRAGQQ